MYVCVNVIHLLFFFFYNKEGNQNVEFSFKRKHKAAHSVAVVPRGGGRRLQLLGLAVFWFGLWRGVRVLGLLLVHPHVGVQASLEQQLIVSLDGEKVNHSRVWWKEEGLPYGCQYDVQNYRSHLPSSLSDPAIANNQNLVGSNYGGQSLKMKRFTQHFRQTTDILKQKKIEKKLSEVQVFTTRVSYLWATTTVVRLEQTLANEAWMLRSVCVSSADVA